MCKKLLISDANIIIDIIAGELSDAIFALPYEFGTPDILYIEELDEQHPELIDAGLKLLELQPVAIDDATELYQKNMAKVSVNDCIALALAKQEACELLTGDTKLKQLASIEGITVHGTLWLVEAMFESRLTSATGAETAYKKMKNDGSRLPWDRIEKQLKKFKGK